MTMTKLDWLKLIQINKVKKTRMDHYGLPLPKFTQYLRTWGEAGIIKTGKDGKTGDQGVTGMFMGSTSNHKRGRLHNVESENKEGFRDT